MALRSVQALQRRSFSQFSALFLRVTNGELEKASKQNFLALPCGSFYDKKRQKQHKNNDADIHELHYV